MLQNNENLKNGKFKYTKDFLLQQRSCSTEAPVGFHPVYINQKRIEITQNSTIAPPKELPKELPNELPKESFKESYPINQINQTITNNIRILLNKLTPKNHTLILDQLNDF